MDLSFVCFFLLGNIPVGLLNHILHLMAHLPVGVAKLLFEVTHLGFVFEYFILQLHSLIVSIQLHFLLRLALDFDDF